MPIRSQQTRRQIAVALIQIEGALILALGLFVITKGLVSSGTIEWFVISGIVILVCFGGIGLLAAAKGFKTYKNYGRGPAVLANLIAIGVSKYIFEAGFWWAAIPLALYALFTIYLIVTLRPKENQ